MAAGAFSKKKLLLPLAVTGLVAAFAANVKEWWGQQSYFGDMIVYDHFAVAFNGLLILAALFVFLLSYRFYRKFDAYSDEIFALLLFSLFGALLMVSFGNLTTLFIGIETLSISLYILAGSRKLSLYSNEAALKYFLMGAFATGVMLFGIALIYGASGSFDFHEISAWVKTYNGVLPVYFKTGIFMFAVGLLFKIAAVPFHFWAPDVYEGAPTLITAFMATVSKVAGITAFYRIFAYHFVDVEPVWFTAMCIIAMLTMIVGNFTALFQHGMKRLMAFSGIAQTGYMMIAIVAMNDFSMGALLLYSVVYVLAVLAIFAVLIGLSADAGSDDMDIFNGLARTRPLYAFGLAVALLSLSGIPPLGGFMAKYFVFLSGIENQCYLLVGIGILTSVVSMAYYLKPVINAFSKHPSDTASATIRCPVITFILVMSIAGLILTGVMPSLVFRLL